MTARLTILLTTAMAIAVIVAGCGGGDDSSATGSANGQTVTTSDLSKEEFVKQATDICHRERQDILPKFAAYIEKHEPPHPTKAQETKLFADMFRAVLLTTIEKELNLIRKLGAPEGEEDEVAAILNAEQEAVETAAKVRHIVSRFQIERYFTEAAKLARAYGIGDCGNDSGPLE